MNYYLIGMMGSGKTTIGNYLKQDLNYKLYDLDNYIEEKWNLNCLLYTSPSPRD